MRLCIDDCEPELENLPPTIWFLPCINQREETIICPNAITQLFVNAYMARPKPLLMTFSSSKELAILSWLS